MKLNEIAQNVDIDYELAKMDVKDYTIRNGKVDVEGNVYIPASYTSIPIPFGHVSGDFQAAFSRITSLRNSPIEVGGKFWCHTTPITSLIGGPREVGGNFSCTDTNITTLKGAPMFVGGDFSCGWTELKSLEGAPREIGGNLICTRLFDEEPDTYHIRRIGGEVIWK